MMALAEKEGLADHVGELRQHQRPAGVNAQLKVPCLVAGRPRERTASMTWTCCGTAR